MDIRLISKNKIKRWFYNSGGFAQIYFLFFGGFSLMQKGRLDIVIYIIGTVLLLSIALDKFYQIDNIFLLDEGIKDENPIKSRVQGLEKTSITESVNKYKNLILDKDSVYRKEINASINIIDKVVENLHEPVENMIEIINGESIDDKDLETIESKGYEIKDKLQELIESAKISIGIEKFSLSDSDISSLIREKILYYEEDFINNDLELIKELESNEYIVEIDGEKISRALDIFLENIFKFAQKGTRVYITSKIVDNKFFLELKNISREKLNIHSEEFFNSKAGLSIEIAKGIIDNLGGKISIHIDGDLFKVQILFEGRKENGVI